MRRLIFCLLGVFILAASTAYGDITGSISGMVRDPSGAVIPAAKVKATNVSTGVAHSVVTNARGFYTFPALPIGKYNVDIEKRGFIRYEITNLMVNVNTALRVDATLQVGAVTQAVTVSGTAVHVETTSTQMGEVIGSTKMVALPLNGRSYTDLLALQPGVVPISSGEYAAYNPSGELNPGSLSISGQREDANGFMVNGATVEEGIWDATAIIPNLDSISEFRILTNNFDAEYGNYSGGQVNVATKSGTNQFHGDAFEFLRNSDMDSRNFFSPTRGVLKRNQFGGTFGGPIRRDKVFFFADYQGTREIDGIDTGDIPVPSAADRAGDLSDVASSLTGTVNGQYWANTLASELGYPVSVGEHYYTPGCTSTTNCLFPGAIIPQRAWASPSSKLMQYIPTANVPGGFFSTSAFDETIRDDKGSVRLDGDSRFGRLSAYYIADNYTEDNPYAGGTVPGFSAVTPGMAQLLVLSDTKAFDPSTLNQFSFSYMRDANLFGDPVGGVGPTLESLGFASPSDYGPYPLLTTLQGVPSIALNNFSFGENAYPEGQYNNTFQWQDDFSKVIGTHTIKFGGDYHYDQINTRQLGAASNGFFSFTGAESGLDFADYLLGAVSSYNQGYAPAMDQREYYLGLYGQDSWRATSNLTLNFGARWEIIPNWLDTRHRVANFVPGEQSVLFPDAPEGYVFPGDPGVPDTLSPTRYGNVGPRLGLAYSPNPSGGFLHKVFGGSGKTSIRMGYGIYYTAIEGQVTVNDTGDSPYGLFWASPAPPLFAQPFLTRSDGVSQGQHFPVTLPPSDVSAAHPDANVNWAQYEPISSEAAYPYSNENPYTESYMFSLERQFGTNTLLNLSYVGTEAHHLVDDIEGNPGDAALCLSVSQASEVIPGTSTCGPFGENGVYYPITGGIIDGTRAPLGPKFGSIGFYSTLGNSNYNALEVTLHHTTGGMEFLAGYTYSKSLDNASGYGEQVNPFNPALSEGLSSFDITNNFVFSYTYELPFSRFLHSRNRLTQGWKVTGLTHFATGLPVTLYEYDDNSLIGSYDSGPNGNGVDLPNFTPGKILNDTNPRNARTYFNTSLFAPEPLGRVGTADRRFFHGPGLNDWDMALLKDVRLTESKTLEFRGEFFNAFNHAQFYGPSAVNGNINSTAFGLVTSAAAPRIVQVAAKLLF